MFAQMRHMAIVTSNADHEGNFYRDVFGMKRSSITRAGGAVVVGDGYVGLNLNPRAPGRQAGFDHFGFEVQDVEVVFGRLKEKYPKVQVLHRPSNRPFAGISMHDPNGNVWVNSLHYGYDELPFGGVKSSGVGREHGPEALDYYLEPKGVVVVNV